MKDEIKRIFNESAELKRKSALELSSQIEDIAKMLIKSVKNGGKIVLFGNGGSAADAQHMQAELTHQFEVSNRKAIPCIALTTNTSVLTAIGNDWGFDRVFERQVEKFIDKKDIVIGFTTSGNSINVIKGIKQAKKEGAKTIAFSGRDGGKIKDISDICLIVPANNTARIQEVHITVVHILCGLIEKELSKDSKNK